MPGRFPETETTVRKFFEGGAKRLLLQLVAGQGGLDRPIREPAINRPGLGLGAVCRIGKFFQQIQQFFSTSLRIREIPQQIIQFNA